MDFPTNPAFQRKPVWRSGWGRKILFILSFMVVRFNVERSGALSNFTRTFKELLFLQFAGIISEGKFLLGKGKQFIKEIEIEVIYKINSILSSNFRVSHFISKMKKTFIFLFRQRNFLVSMWWLMVSGGRLVWAESFYGKIAVTLQPTVGPRHHLHRQHYLSNTVYSILVYTIPLYNY